MYSTEELKLSVDDPTKDTLDVGTLDALKLEVDRCMMFSGFERGASLDGDKVKAIEHKEGEGSAKKIEEKLKEIGHPVNLFEFKYHEWYPLGYAGAILLTATHLFSWTTEDIEELGAIGLKNSFFKSIIFRFASMGGIYKAGPSAWKKVYDAGELVGVELSEEERFLTMDLCDYRNHLAAEYYHKGYFEKMVALGSGSEEAHMEILQSIHRGDDRYRYKFTW
ncbi:MAG: hypothetical protein U5L75_00900 [Candidatus Campbellbacteria bacterium]|nr:hypothetical protein [Candidatus Campbellbacteria bacterium]